MNASKSVFIVPYFVLLSAFFGLAQVRAEADETRSSQRSSSMVFDPESKKYFIGGNAKFMLKRGEGSSLIERIDGGIL